MTDGLTDWVSWVAGGWLREGVASGCIQGRGDL
jgi:hypothetical protein